MIIFGIHITWSWLLSICIGFLGIGIMILVHELGHAFAAKACGINVEVLRFGFGPALFKWYKGDTTYIIGVIPFGGSCKMTGNDDLQDALKRKKKYIESGEDGSIWGVGPIKRALTYLAGPAANMLFAFLCCALLITLPSVVSHAPAKVAISSDYPSIYNIDSNAASKAGLKTGDLVLEIDGVAVESYTHMQMLLAERKDNEYVSIKTNRGNFTVYPENGIFGFVPFREPIVGYVTSDTPEKEAGLKAKDII
ncbi:MAG: site-2 protease family protein, partial [Sphaerochaetaceae bacterium]|nr:site-2 protease family protein [Sphaerochaetaceae bacterium]